MVSVHSAMENAHPQIPTLFETEAEGSQEFKSSQGNLAISCLKINLRLQGAGHLAQWHKHLPGEEVSWFSGNKNNPPPQKKGKNGWGCTSL